jgi:hypothetical protein
VNKETAVKSGKYKLSGPYTHSNLAVFLIHGEDELKNKNFLTLQEAIQQKKVIVHETQQVNELSIENVSANEEVFVQAGDIVKGGQQDRVIGYDLIVSAKSGRVPLASFCVEAGRWSGRGEESARTFAAGAAPAPTKGLKLAIRQGKDQHAVWENVARAQGKLGENVGLKSLRSAVSPSSLELTLETKELQQALDGYIKTLQPITEAKSDVIGFAFAVNGKVNGADIYVSHALFQKLWPMLLKGSAMEAFSEFKKDQEFDPAPAQAVAAFLTDAEKGKAAEKEVTKRVKLIQRENPNSILFESRDAQQKSAAPVRKSYLAK